MDCPQSEKTKGVLLKRYGNLQNIEDVIATFLGGMIKQKTIRINCGEKHLVRNKYTGEVYRESPQSETVLEIKYQRWTRISGEPDIAVIPSFYHPECGKIFLRGNCRWCLCNIIHETLHSRSCFSRIPIPPKNLEFVLEGIAELLTGWLLKSFAPECYKIWRIPGQPCFLKPYRRYVKIWYYLCINIVSIRKLCSLYLDYRIKDPFNALIRLLRSEGMASFTNIFLRKLLIDFERFIDETHRVIGKDFAEYQGANIIDFDLSRCL